jgi:hypothetical protein
MQTVTYPTKGCTLVVQTPRKASTEAPNLSKDEICFNFSLSTSIQVSTTIGSQLLSALDLEQSSFIGRTPARWVWAEESVWHHCSVQVMGSQTGEFPDPPPPRHDMHGEDFGGLTWRSQEHGGMHLQGSNCSNSSMGFRATSTTVHHLALYAIMFIELGFNFMSVFCMFIPHVVNYFFPVSPQVRVVQSCRRRVCLRYLRLIWGPLVIFLFRVWCCRTAAPWKS